MSERLGGTALPSILPIFPLTGVLLLPRQDLQVESQYLPAKALSFDPDAGRLARITPECQVELVELARM